MVRKKYSRNKKALKNKNLIIGYTTGVYDLFHIGHLNLLKNAKAMCDKLIVGVSVDELVMYKNKKSIIPFHERIEIVRHCKYVDIAIPQYSTDKYKEIQKIKANYLFVGDDWYQDKKWKHMELKLKKINCKVIYFPYTKGTSSTLINNILIKNRK
jgi:glycerol-3-phosphate cytidylyltransferase